MAFIEKEYNLTIRDIDNNLEITNKAILSYFEDIGGYHSDIAGFGLKNIETTKLSWVLLHWKVKIFKRIKYGEPFKVITWSRGIVKACSLRDYEIYNSKGELCIIGTSKWTLTHLENGLVKLTDEMANQYSIESKATFQDFEYKKLQEPDNYSNIYNYTVSRRDIDINNHMHNLYYLDLAYAALPEEIYNNYKFDNIEIMYKNGAYLGDNLKCLYSCVNNEHFVTIKSEDDTKLHSIIKLY